MDLNTVKEHIGYGGHGDSHLQSRQIFVHSGPKQSTKEIIGHLQLHCMDMFQTKDSKRKQTHSLFRKTQIEASAQTDIRSTDWSLVVQTEQGNNDKRVFYHGTCNLMK